MKKYFKYGFDFILVIVIIVLVFIINKEPKYIKKAEVKRIVLNNINLNEDDIKFGNIKLDKECYEVKINHNSLEYEYKIDAKTGKIIYSNYDILDITKEDNKTTIEVVDKNKSISLSNAKSIALKKVKLDGKKVKYKKEKLNRKKNIYEIEFIYKNYKYEFEIAKSTGKIIEYEKKKIKR